MKKDIISLQDLIPIVSMKMETDLYDTKQYIYSYKGEIRGHISLDDDDYNDDETPIISTFECTLLDVDGARSKDSLYDFMDITALISDAHRNLFSEYHEDKESFAERELIFNRQVTDDCNHLFTNNLLVIDKLWVHPELRQQSLGTQTIDFIKHYFAHRECLMIVRAFPTESKDKPEQEIEKDTDKLREFYKKNGFTLMNGSPYLYHG